MTIRLSYSTAGLALLTMGAFGVSLASSAVRAVEAEHFEGWFGVAYTVARFPDQAKAAVTQVADTMTGAEADKHLTVPGPEGDLAGFTPVTTLNGASLPGLVLADSGMAEPGWRVISGTMWLDGAPASVAALLTPGMEVIQTWRLHEEAVPDIRPTPDSRRVVHGIEITPDGGILFAFDNGSSLQKFDACGTPLWANVGSFHHAVTLSDDGTTAWTMAHLGPEAGHPELYEAGTDGFRRIDIATGATVEAFSVAQLVAANPRIGLFEIPRKELDTRQDNPIGTEGKWLVDPWHFNDVDPLPAALAPAFPMFEAGDLLISSRTLNAVFVVDPDTLEVKWHRAGVTKRQHDPDWRPDGTISIYDNRMGQGVSDIIAIDPATFALAVTLDGASQDFYSNVRGKHQWLPGGGLLVTASQQGRVFEIDASGRRTLEVYSLKPQSPFAYSVTEALWLPPEALTQEMYECSTN